MMPRTDHKKLNLVIQHTEETAFLYQNTVFLHPRHLDYNAPSKLYFIKLVPVHPLRHPQFYFPVNFSPVTHADGMLVSSRLKEDLGLDKLPNLETSMLVLDAKSCVPATDIIFTIEKRHPLNEKVQVKLVEEEILKKVNLPYHFSIGQRIYVPCDRFGQEGVLLVVDQINGDTAFSETVYAASTETTLRCRLSSNATNLTLTSSRSPAQLSQRKNSDLLPMPVIADTVTKSFVYLSREMEQIIDEFNLLLTGLQQGNLNRLPFLITGDPGTGKTTLAMYLAQLTKAKSVNLLSINALLGLPVDKQLAMVDTAFETIKQSNLSVIVLDDLENLIMADAELQTYSNPLRLKFQALLKEQGDAHHKAIIFATTSQLGLLRRLQLAHLFGESKSLSPVTLRWCDDVTVSTLASKLGYRLVQPLKASLGNDTATISIRDLVYLIKKFATVSKSTELDLNGLYALIKGNSLKGESKLTPVLQHTGSPLTPRSLRT